jgi:hypothetical protein
MDTRKLSQQDMEALTPEQMAKIQADFDALNKEQLDELQRGLDERNEQAKREENRDYTMRRKIIYKGKMAWKGCLYIVVNVKKGTKKYEAHQMIIGKQGEAYENQVAQSLRDLIKQKYHV